MADDAASDPFSAGSANLRETAKWLVGGIVTTAVAVLAGSPLTNLGALDVGSRMAVAIAGAVVAYGLLGVLLWKALQVIAADTVSVYQLAQATGAEAQVRRRLERRFAGSMPANCQTFALLDLEGQMRVDDQTAGHEARYDAFMEEMARFNQILGFEYKRDRFIRMRSAVVWLTPRVILGVGLFAWAANPPAEPKPLTEQPRFSAVVLEADGVAALAPAIEARCYGGFRAGRLHVPAVAVAHYANGRTDFITLPSAPGCDFVRLVEQNGRVFSAK